MPDADENRMIEEEMFEGCELKPATRILMIVTNTDRFDEHHKTGVWFEEFAVPFNRFKEEGYFVTVSSLKGGNAPIDPDSENLIKDIKWKDAKTALEDTTPLESIDYKLYDVLVFPGGHGPMFDIVNSELIGEIVNYFSEKSRLITAICHGPAGLLPAQKDNVPFVDGRKLTCFTNEEEACAKKDKLTPFFLEDALKQKNAFFMKMPEGEVNVVEDDNLITAQNHQSVEAFTTAVIKYLKDKK